MKFGKSSEILSGYRRGIIQVYWKSLSDGFPLLFFVRNAIIKGIVRRAWGSAEGDSRFFGRAAGLS